MFERIKLFLGIESVKIKLVVPADQPTAGQIIGQVVFTSMSTQKVEGLTISLLEQYTQGRKKQKEKQTFELGSITLDKTFEVPANKEIKVNFKLHYTPLHSEMDKLADSNPLLKGVTKAAKFIGNIQSEYELVAEAQIKGTALDPFDRVILML